MSDRVRNPDGFQPYLDFIQEFCGGTPLAFDKMNYCIQRMIETVVIHTDPIPGSPPDVRAKAIAAAQEFIDTLEPGMSVNREMLMAKSGLPKDNRSDSIFMLRWAKENAQLNFDPGGSPHFVKQLTNGATH